MRALFFCILTGCTALSPTPPDWLAVSAAESQAPPCDPSAAPLSVDRTVRLRLFYDDAVPPERFAEQTRLMASMWATWGVTFELAAPAQQISLNLPLVGSPEQIDAALMAAGVDPRRQGQDIDPNLVEQIVGDVVLGPIRAHLNEHAVPAAEEIHVVLVPTLASPNSAATRVFRRMEGLTLTASDHEVLGALAHALRLGQPFTPTVVIGLDHLKTANPDRVDNTLSHEVGHALGLTHHADLGNLMAKRPPRCWPSLDAEQLSKIRTGAQ